MAFNRIYNTQVTDRLQVHFLQSTLACSLYISRSALNCARSNLESHYASVRILVSWYPCVLVSDHGSCLSRLMSCQQDQTVALAVVPVSPRDHASVPLLSLSHPEGQQLSIVLPAGPNRCLGLVIVVPVGSSSATCSFNDPTVVPRLTTRKGLGDLARRAKGRQDPQWPENGLQQSTHHTSYR